MKYTVEQAEKLIAATNEAGKRSRQLAYFIGLFTIFAFVILWDSGQFGWVRQRHGKLSALEAEYDRFTASRAKSDTTWNEFTQKSDHEDFFKNRPFLKSDEQLHAYKEMHDDLMKEALVVEAPILGVTFDINNFPLFYGLSFWLLMAIMAVNLDRELQFQTFTISVVTQFKGTDFKYLYHLFAMGQVLTSPEKVKIRWLEYFLYYGPTIMMIFIVVYDACTLGRRLSTSDSHIFIWGQLFFEFGILWAMFRKSRACYNDMNKINTGWVELNTTLPSLEAPEDGNANDPEPSKPGPPLPSPPAAPHVGGADNPGTPPPANAQEERPKRKRGGN